MKRALAALRKNEQGTAEERLFACLQILKQSTHLLAPLLAGHEIFCAPVRLARSHSSAFSRAALDDLMQQVEALGEPGSLRSLGLTLPNPLIPLRPLPVRPSS